MPASVTDAGGQDAINLTERFLGAPETTRPKCSFFNFHSFLAIPLPAELNGREPADDYITFNIYP
jgi:hypothetical protein